MGKMDQLLTNDCLLTINEYSKTVNFELIIKTVS